MDVYVPGCPPRPEALLYGVMKLQEKIQEDRVLRRKGDTAGQPGRRVDGARGQRSSDGRARPSTSGWPRSSASGSPRSRPRPLQPWAVVAPDAIAEVAGLLQGRPRPRLRQPDVPVRGRLSRRRRRRGWRSSTTSTPTRTATCFVLKVHLPREAPAVPTVEGVWGVANWHEREAFDMFGIVLRGPQRPAPHPAPRRLGWAIRCARTGWTPTSTTACT